MGINRGCGILMHPTSLPGDEPIGTFGNNAFDFVDTLCKMGVSYWQVLPLNPPSCCNSPYSAYSAFAGNPLLIDLETLVREGDLFSKSWSVEVFGNVDFKQCEQYKETALHTAATAFFAGEKTERMNEFWHFCDTTSWLHDYALFMALQKKYKGKPWWSWTKTAALIDDATYKKASVECGEEIGAQKYIQWQFYRQWSQLKEYANSKKVSIIGDIPIFVARNSVDVWRNRSLFLLDTKGKPQVVAGVPPDYFSKTGQLWGNPLYNWEELKKNEYGWWQERFAWMFKHFDKVRIDHFRGFEAAWHIPAGQKNAINGRWVQGPGTDLFEVLSNKFSRLPLIAEDLGVITQEVEVLRDRFEFPGMKILQFAFGSGSGNPYLPHNHIKRSVVYTGTHDNNTTLGWYNELTESDKQAIHDYLGDISADSVSGLLRAACMSVADTVIVPLQDVLGIGTEGRMNVPGCACGNWEWRIDSESLANFDTTQFKEFLAQYGRICE